MSTSLPCVQMVDGRSKKHGLPGLQNFTTPTTLNVDSENTCAMRVAISNTKPSPTTSISSCVHIDSSPASMIIRTTPALSLNAPVKEGNEDKQTSPHSRKRLNELSGLLVSRHLTNADVAHVGFRKPDELILLDKVEEENMKRKVSHIFDVLDGNGCQEFQ